MREKQRLAEEKKAGIFRNQLVAFGQDSCGQASDSAGGGGGKSK